MSKNVIPMGNYTNRINEDVDTLITNLIVYRELSNGRESAPEMMLIGECTILEDLNGEVELMLGTFDPETVNEVDKDSAIHHWYDAFVNSSVDD